MAWKAFVESGSGLLLGGVKRVESVRFEHRPHAQRWLEATLAGNREANRDIRDSGLEFDAKPHDISLTSTNGE